MPLVRIHPFQFGEAEISSDEISLPDEEAVIEEVFGPPASALDEDVQEPRCPRCEELFDGLQCHVCGYEVEGEK